MYHVGNGRVPTAEHLFDVNDQQWEKLDNNDAANLFHHNIAKLLVLCKCARPDVQTGSGSIPVRRVQKADVDDDAKVERVMQCLCATTDMDTPHWT